MTDVRQVVRRYTCPKQESEATTLLDRGWRAEHILPTITRLLEGKLAIRVGDPAGESPLALFEST
jgi:hypothetical protein